ncbi:MAG: TolC family protein [Bacteroidia bacterium]
MKKIIYTLSFYIYHFICHCARNDSRFLSLQILILLFLSPFSLAFTQNDSTQITLTQLFSVIDKYHPVAKQVALLSDVAKNRIMQAKGAWDPYFYTYSSGKTHKGTNYFSLWETGLKIPTYYGVDFKVEYENNGGKYLNEEHSVPGNGLLLAGLSVPLAQGLLIDQRRTTLKQAEIFKKSVEWEQIQALNEVYYDAAVAYYEWSLAQAEVEVLQKAYQVSYQRLQGIKELSRLGDRAKIDTLEAFLQVQARQFDLNNGKLKFKNQALWVSNFLWKENDTPVELAEEMKPISLTSFPIRLFSQDDLQLTVNQLGMKHPAMRLYQLKLANLEVERRWKQEKLKPKVNLEYNMLSQEVGKTPIFYKNPFTDNYKWGLMVAMPLYLRAERADLAMQRLKIRDTELAMQQKQRDLGTKVKTYYNEAQNWQNQVELYNSMIQNYQTMLTAEETLFQNGESSVFLINSRESKLIEAQNKALELRFKFFKSIAGMTFSAGQFYQPTSRGLEGE